MFWAACKETVQDLLARNKNTGISHTLTQQILKENQFKFQRYQKQLKLAKENITERLKFAREMKRRWIDWGFIIFTDESSFWREKRDPRKFGQK